jgi:UDP-N-acetyl-D-galactosamine dehydrogenase
VYESTVYPGVTEDVCGKILEDVSGLSRGRDFKLGYSPERINPGDPSHTLERTVKVVAAQDAETLALLAELYGAIVPAGVHRAPSIQVAEAAKVIENVQRDLNIALMNELAILFDRLGLPSRAVLDAAATKWNFHRYHPGLVGGHCIGVDPYYLTTKAESVGLHPQVILAGRRVNDEMGRFVAAKCVKLLIQRCAKVSGARVAVLGIAFKPDVGDVRNSRVPDIVEELRAYGVDVLVHDPLAEPAEVAEEYGIELASPSALEGLDAVVLATPHRELVPLAPRLGGGATGARLLLDVLGRVEPREVPPGVTHWSL